jgi:hypothetical protein
MITAETLLACEKENLAELTPTLAAADIEQLVEWLNEKDDNLRYKSFLLLQDRSQKFDDVYPYWDTLVTKLGSDNSYQRSLGLMLLADNVRWDQLGKFEGLVDTYLSFCDDEKPVTVRQCIQSLVKVVPHKPACLNTIVDRLLSIDVMQRKETQRKLVLLDILSVLTAIQKLQPDERISLYVHTALTGGILDAKAKRQVEAM